MGVLAHAARVIRSWLLDQGALRSLQHSLGPHYAPAETPTRPLLAAAAVRVGAFAAMSKLVSRTDAAEAEGMLKIMAQVMHA